MKGPVSSNFLATQGLANVQGLLSGFYFRPKAPNFLMKVKSVSTELWNYYLKYNSNIIVLQIINKHISKQKKTVLINEANGLLKLLFWYFYICWCGKVFVRVFAVT